MNRYKMVLRRDSYWSLVTEWLPGLDRELAVFMGTYEQAQHEWRHLL